MAVEKKDLALAGVAAAAAAVAGAHGAAAADAGWAPTNWEGAYVGAEVGIMGGDYPVNQDTDYRLDQSIVFGGFIGYDHHISQSVVLSGEFALQSGAGASNGGSDTDYGIHIIADGKVKLGMDMGNIHPYIEGGISGLTQTVGFGASGKDYSSFGVNYGVGVDVAVADHFTIGAEVLARTWIDPYTDVDVHSSRTNVQGMLRAAFHF